MGRVILYRLALLPASGSPLIPPPPFGGGQRRGHRARPGPAIGPARGRTRWAGPMTSSARSGGANWQSHAVERTPPRPSIRNRACPISALNMSNSAIAEFDWTGGRELRRQHLTDLADQLAQMERLRQYLRLLGRPGIRI